MGMGPRSKARPAVLGINSSWPWPKNCWSSYDEVHILSFANVHIDCLVVIAATVAATIAIPLLYTVRYPLRLHFMLLVLLQASGQD